MDDVENLLKEIQEDKNIVNTKFSSSFLDNVSEVYEKHGFGVTKVFLLEKQKREKLREQARALLNVLNKLERYPRIKSDRKIVRLIIKVLKALTPQRRR